jgi:hypothetical protein
MVLRTAGAIVTLLIGLGAQALAQPYPPQQAYPRQPFPSSDELPPLSMPVVQGAPLPPVGVGPADGDRSGTASHSAVSALPLSPKSQPGPQDYGPPGYYGLRGTIPPGPPASAKESAIREEATRSRLRVRPGQIGSGASRSAWRRLARQYHHARAYLNAAIDSSRPHW